MTCGSPSFSFKFSFSLCPFITCCLFVEKNCQHAVLPEMVVRCLMYNRSACAHNCSYVWYCNISSLPWVCGFCVMQGQQKMGEAQKYLLQPLRKSRWPWCEVLHVMLPEQTHIHQCEMKTDVRNFHWLFFSLTSVICTQNQLTLPAHEHTALQKYSLETSWLKEQFCRRSCIAVLLPCWVAEGFWLCLFLLRNVVDVLALRCNLWQKRNTLPPAQLVLIQLQLLHLKHELIQSCTLGLCYTEV